MKKIIKQDYKGEFTLFAIYYGKRFRIGFTKISDHIDILGREQAFSWFFSFKVYHTFMQLCVLGLNVAYKFKNYEKYN